MKNRRQLAVFGILLAVDALLAALTYLLVPLDQISLAQGAPSPTIDIPRWQLALANGGIVLVPYGLLGLAGYWFARGLGLPGIFREGAGWRRWFWWPLGIGLVVGVAIVVMDRAFAAAGQWPGFSHPTFPLSIVASATAGIGEEILFRMFVLGLWAFLANLLLRRWGVTWIALWIGNLVAALAFGAGHLPAVMLLLGAASPDQIPPLVLAELFLLNGLMGLVAGRWYLREGLVAAAGIHFWADIVWHVIWPLVGI